MKMIEERQNGNTELCILKTRKMILTHERNIQLEINNKKTLTDLTTNSTIVNLSTIHLTIVKLTNCSYIL